MTDERSQRVSNPPPKPLLIWDGDCNFCRLWIERWGEITAGNVEFATYQEAAARFPKVSVDEFQHAIVFIEPDGQVFVAAEAVYRSLACERSREWLAWSYDHLPGFAAVSETLYRLIAGHRKLASAVTGFLWGKDVRRPTYFWARRWFLRALGAIYPDRVRVALGSSGRPYWQRRHVACQSISAGSSRTNRTRRLGSLPTLCWLNSSNAFLHLLCGSGVLFSLLLIFGIAPAISLLVLFIFYLSLTIAGQIFFNFQWDVLLLETGFLSIFFAPWQLWPQELSLWPGSAILTTSQVSRPGLFLLKLLLFKLMLMSGVVKLTSGDDSWWNLTALDYHYWSQPLPTVFGWWADKSPEWFKHFSVAFCLVVEIIVPLFIWAPRRLRLAAAGVMIFLQVGIGLTGNYCFFNLLTIALCLLLIDDSVVGTLLRSVRGTARSAVPTRSSRSMGRSYVVILTLPINAWLIFSAFQPLARPPRALDNVYQRLAAFRIVNGYGLFRVMTKDRCEIVLEGSADGVDWLAYEFKWKPGDVKRAPGWCAPHQPRLDWQMWFAALETPRENPWFIALVFRLLQGSHDVSGLLAYNPFPDKPPRYVRAMFYRYRFTTVDELRQTGAWWKRQELREYLPTLSLDQFR